MTMRFICYLGTALLFSGCASSSYPGRSNFSGRGHVSGVRQMRERFQADRSVACPGGTTADSSGSCRSTGRVRN